MARHCQRLLRWSLRFSLPVKGARGRWSRWPWRLTGPLAWNAILRAVNAPQFFIDAPLPVFPVSWQDTGSGVFAFAALALVLGVGPLRSAPSRRLVLLAGLGLIAALVLDVCPYGPTHFSRSRPLTASSKPVTQWACISHVSLVFAGNGFRCPLTQIAKHYGAESGAVTDIYLPKWFAEQAEVQSGVVPQE